MIANNITDEGFSLLMPLLKKDGKLSQLTEFSIGSRVTNVGMKEFAGILAMGALPSLTELNLSGNKISDEGMKAFAAAVGRGALPALKELYVDYELTEHPQLVAACQPRGIEIG